jgi:hypothetical protein
LTERKVESFVTFLFEYNGGNKAGSPLHLDWEQVKYWGTLTVMHLVTSVTY